MFQRSVIISRCFSNARNEVQIMPKKTLSLQILYFCIQDVHKARVHFKKFTTLFVSAIKIICKKN